MRTPSIIGLMLLVGALMALPLAAQDPTVQAWGKGCSPTGARPSLESPAPLMGTKISMQASGLSPFVPVVLVASQVPAVPTMVAPQCFIYVDLDSVMVLAAGMTDDAGLFVHQETIPNDPKLMGLPVALQAVSTLPEGGTEVSQGLLWVIGQ